MISAESLSIDSFAPSISLQSHLLSILKNDYSFDGVSHRFGQHNFGPVCTCRIRARALVRIVIADFRLGNDRERATEWGALFTQIPT